MRNQQQLLFGAKNKVSSRSSTQTSSSSQSFSSTEAQRGSLQRLRAGIFLSDITVGIILSSTTFLVEYFCDMWFESVEISKHYRTAIRVSFQLVAVVIALVLRELLQKLLEHMKGTEKLHVKFTTELFGVIVGGAIVITILFLVAQKN